MSHLSFRNHIPYSALIAFVFVLAAGAENREYQKWLDEDVHWIITPQERAEFAKVSSDEQRDHFVEQFWAGRNPTPARRETCLSENTIDAWPLLTSILRRTSRGGKL